MSAKQSLIRTIIAGKQARRVRVSQWQDFRVTMNGKAALVKILDCPAIPRLHLKAKPSVES